MGMGIGMGIGMAEASPASLQKQIGELQTRLEEAKKRASKAEFSSVKVLSDRSFFINIAKK
jgi:membrane protease subunit (stomatin/prohibitin family)